MTDSTNRSKPYGGCLLSSIKDENTGKELEVRYVNLSKFDGSFPQLQICTVIKDYRDDGSVQETKSFSDINLGSIVDLRTLIDKYFELRSSHVLQFKGKQQ